MRTVPSFINDERVEEAADLPAHNPTSGEVSAHVPIADVRLVDDVVAIARDVATSWRNSTLPAHQCLVRVTSPPSPARR